MLLLAPGLCLPSYIQLLLICKNELPHSLLQGAECQQPCWHSSACCSCRVEQRHEPHLNPTAAGGRAAGVVLQGRGRNPSSSSNGASQQPEIIQARQGVISNASVWDTLKLLPEHAAPQEWTQECSRTPQTGSFMHLHLGEAVAAVGPCFWMDPVGSCDSLSSHSS